jgi:hypothetical protein
MVGLLMAGTKPQRWCLGLTLALVVLTPWLSGFVCRCSNAWASWVTFLRFAPAMLLGPVLFLGGTTFQKAGDLRTVRLIPGGRASVVQAYFLVHVVLASIMAADVAVSQTFATTGTNHAPGPFTVFEWSFALATSWTLSLYLVGTATRWAPVAFAVYLMLAGIGSGFVITVLDGLDRSGHGAWGSAGLPATGALAAWIAFSVWFLNRPMPLKVFPEPPRARFPLDQRLDAFLAAPGSALDAYLVRRSALSRNTLRFLLIFGIMNASQVVLIASEWLRPLRHHLAPNFASPTMVLPEFAGLIAYIQSRGIARSSRSLWIRGGRSRLELFSTSERLSLRGLALVAGLIFPLAGVEWALLPHRSFDTGQFLYMMLTSAEGAAVATYLGLRNFRGAALDIFMVMLQIAVAAWGLGAFWDDQASVLFVALHWIVPLVIPLALLILRRIVRAQWSRVDWLACKPEKDPGPFFARSA